MSKVQRPPKGAALSDIRAWDKAQAQAYASKSKRLKVQVKLTIMVDRDSWDLNYGLDETDAQIAGSIRSDARDLLTDHLMRRGLEVTVEQGPVQPWELR